MTAVPRTPRARAAVIAAGPAAAAALVLLATGTVKAPDVEGALTGLAESLGAWTYALVAALAFLETGAFVGLIAPGETAIVLGGVVAAEGEVSLPLIALAAWLAAALGDLASLRARAAAGPALPRRPRPEGRRHRAAARARRRLLRPPRRQGDPDRPLRRHRARGRAVRGRRVGHRGCAGSCPTASPARCVWATAFTLVGYAFHESFETAAGALTHGALALAVLAAAVVAVRTLRGRRDSARAAPRTTA